MVRCAKTDEILSLDSVPFQIRYEAMRMVFEASEPRKPEPFACLPAGWVEDDSADAPLRRYVNAAAGLHVEVSSSQHLGQEDYLTFEVSRTDGEEPSYATMRQVRQAFLGRGRVALLLEPFAEDGPRRVMYSSLTGERLPRFTVTLEGAPA